MRRHFSWWFATVALAMMVAKPLHYVLVELLGEYYNYWWFEYLWFMKHRKCSIVTEQGYLEWYGYGGIPGFPPYLGEILWFVYLGAPLEYALWPRLWRRNEEGAQATRQSVVPGSCEEAESADHARAETRAAHKARALEDAGEAPGSDLLSQLLRPFGIPLLGLFFLWVSFLLTDSVGSNWCLYANIYSLFALADWAYARSALNNKDKHFGSETCRFSVGSGARNDDVFV
jgi:hypothetical protein